MSYTRDKWIDGVLPKKEVNLNRDAVEILLRMAWEEAIKYAKEKKRADDEEEEFEKQHGPRYI